MMCHVITSTCALPTSYSIFCLFFLSLFSHPGQCFPVLSSFFISSLFSPHYLLLVPCHDLLFHLCPFSYSILAVFSLLLVRFFSPFIPSILLFLASLIYL
ncbi:hypothetical protein BJ165DRAFT_1467272 [Panaeolus papilionaceus]|nr:hypothetical protein BJ165DRAFT_1467272 [Panaeolus papilionaceus]